MAAPIDTTIDYDRVAALPFAFPPALSADRLAEWLGRLPAGAAILHYVHPDHEDYDPGSTRARRVRGAPFADMASDEMVLPVSSGGRVDAADGSYTDDSDGPYEIGSAQLDAVRDGADFDRDADDASPLPIPMLADESLLVGWLDAAPAATPLLDAPLAGVAPGAALGDARYLLATSADGFDGELDPLLLRAPAAGAFRFEPYHHLVRDAGGSLTLRRRSRSGRLHLRASPLKQVRAVDRELDPSSPIRDALSFVFEHVDAESTRPFLQALLTDHVVNHAVLLEHERMKGDGALARELRTEVGWIFRAWLGLGEHAPELLAVPGAVASALRGWIEAGREPGAAAVTDAAAHVAGSAEAQEALATFLEGFFVPALTGEGWDALGVATASPATDAHRDVVQSTTAWGRWIVCYAGAPLGHPAPAWPADVLATAPRDVWWSGRTRFQVEALWQADPRGDAERDHAAARAAGPPPADALETFAREVLGLHTPGYLCAFRVADPVPGLQHFTTEDWLEEVARGMNRDRWQAPLVDFATLAEAGHPLFDAVDWGRWLIADGARERMDTLYATEIRGEPLQAASLQWWIDNTHFDNGAGQWPAVAPAGVPDWDDADPVDPYKRASGRRNGRDYDEVTHSGTCGFDRLDLLMAQQVAAAVRDGKGGGRTLDPAVVLALADKEGYRFLARDNRRAPEIDEFWGNRVTYATSAPSLRDTHAFRIYAAWGWWLVSPFGLDVLAYRRGHPGASFGDASFITVAETRFREVYDELVAPRDPADPESAILPASSLPSGDLGRYARQRFSARWDASGVLQMRRRSRKLQRAGLVLQAAVFEWVHRQVHEGAAYDGKPYAPNDDFAGTDVPPRGEQANSETRRDYIAYYAALYLAFNTHPSTWSSWMAQAGSARALLYDLAPSFGATVETSEATLGHMVRFAATLDAYLRLNLGIGAYHGPEDVTDPADRRWEVP